MIEEDENIEDSFNLLSKLVDRISLMLQEEGITANVDFDHRDGIVIIKYQIPEEKLETTCIIYHKSKMVIGVDISKLWMPDYNKSQRVVRKLSTLLEGQGYCFSTC